MTPTIFLSYASQDADAAHRICDALRAAGQVVWFDQSELRGGDAWDASIRKQIKECTLFVPIISANTNVREEGYFRLEWKLAVDRSHLMADHKSFFLPVVWGDLLEATAHVPDKFRERQWSRLHDDKSISDFATRVQQIVSTLDGVAPQTAPVSLVPNVATDLASAGGTLLTAPVVSAGNPSARRRTLSRFSQCRERIVRLKGPIVAIVGVGAVLSGLLGYLSVYKTVAAPTAAASSSALSTDAGPLSIVVLPFTNFTGDPSQAYVADGLTDSITADLSRISDAFVVGTSSVQTLKDTTMTLQQIGGQLGVRFVLQGNVQRNGTTLRINARLADATSNAQLWAESFEGDSTDLFALQDQVTTRIGNSMGRELVIRAAYDSEKRKSNPTTADWMLQARALALKPESLPMLRESEALYRKVLAIERHNDDAMAGLANALGRQALTYAGKLDAETLESKLKEALQLANAAIDRNPKNGLAYSARRSVAFRRGDFDAALSAALTRLELEPKNPSAHASVGMVHYWRGEFEPALRFMTQAIALDPKNPSEHMLMLCGWATFALGLYDESVAWSAKGMAANAGMYRSDPTMAVAYTLKGDREKAAAAVSAVLKNEPAFTLTSYRKDQRLETKPDAYRKWYDQVMEPALRKAGFPE